MCYNIIEKIKFLDYILKNNQIVFTILFVLQKKGSVIMTYDELVTKVKDATKTARVSKTVGHIAFQFNVEGEGHGAFYLEISDGKINVEPYEYYDRDMIIVTTADMIEKMLNGDISPLEAYTNEQIQVHGDVKQLKVLPFGCECKAKAKL